MGNKNRIFGVERVNAFSAKFSAMYGAMTGSTQCQPIGNCSLKFRHFPKAFNVMDMKIFFGETSTTSIFITLQNEAAPLLIKRVLSRTARYFCNAAFPFVIVAALVGKSHFFSCFRAMPFSQHRFEPRVMFNCNAPRCAAAILNSVSLSAILSKFRYWMPCFAAITPFVSRISLRKIFIDRNADGVCRSFCISESSHHGL